ncbi:ribosomal silencing factor during starvation domain-containing protein [Ditylenchus destructor]|uniref:Ribosomal silencing factor during starvation domain-containing protein n=1 Tax=Ditylenchus destructor TaxID=166010 RepID=A0AAD4MMV6_9BILA|nr:ribosomal silencing factor during starvation domain-containing protein [Ditylenchus destructor]
MNFCARAAPSILHCRTSAHLMRSLQRRLAHDFKDVEKPIKISRANRQPIQLPVDKNAANMSSDEKLQADLEKVRQMNDLGEGSFEYRRVYVLVYQISVKKEPVIRDLKSVYTVTPESVIELLRRERAKNIVCMKLDPNDGPFPYVILCTPYNHKHADVIAMEMRKFIKHNFFYPRGRLPAKNPKMGDWYTFDLRNVMVHMMSDENRQKYDFETLFGIGPERRESPYSGLNLAVNEAYLPPSAVVNKS